ncbi:hypothetical protein L1887_13493 [Cichorium endivia]|nr:hypothetical protein L1887_13493 [Cichorium endivia]
MEYHIVRISSSSDEPGFPFCAQIPELMLRKVPPNHHLIVKYTSTLSLPCPIWDMSSDAIDVVTNKKGKQKVLAVASESQPPPKRTSKRKQVETSLPPPRSNTKRKKSLTHKTKKTNQIILDTSSSDDEQTPSESEVQETEQQQFSP